MTTVRAVIFVNLLWLLFACQPATSQENTFLVSVVADGRERTFVLTQSLTVEAFLSQADVGITLGDNDRLTPPRFTQLTDGMRVTVVRVQEETVCEQTDIPYQQEVIQNELLKPGEQRLLQTGQNGRQEACYRVSIEDGVRRERTLIGQPTVLVAPVNETVVVGMTTQVEPIPIVGTLAYINNNNAWGIIGNSTNKQPLTTQGNLDSLVFSLSPDGRYLLYTAKPIGEDKFLNELWLVRTSGDSPPIRLVPTDVLQAEWLLNEENTISYSTAEVQNIFPFWRALNNLFIMKIDPISGRSLNIRQVVNESGGGLLGWWGTVYRWSPDGETLAWVRADGMGIVRNGIEVPLLQYPFFRTTQNWSWRANVSWSSDSELIATTVHGAPIGNEPPETSPVFDAVVTDRNGTFKANLYGSAGMWSAPKFSPLIANNTSEFAEGYIAYLRSREPFNSVNGDYELMVADRDGSNARVIFPKPSQGGIRTQDFGVTPEDYVWSPDGRSLAVVYQGNLWVVDVVSGVAHQLTFDGQTEHPAWSR